MTTKEAKEYLQRIEDIDIRIKNKSIEKADHEALKWDIATSITANMSGERVQSSGSKHKMADAIDDKVNYAQNIDKQIAKLETEKQEIISTIELLPKDEYDILHKAYVQYKKYATLKEVAAERDESYSATTTTHGIALTHLAAILTKRKATVCN